MIASLFISVLNYLHSRFFSVWCSNPLFPKELFNGTFNNRKRTIFQIQVVDLRSDTVSKPTEEMRKAMFEAAVGDDVYGEDPTVNGISLPQKSCLFMNHYMHY
jgi:hypothetical protein